MTNDELCLMIEEEGLEYVIRNINPDEVFDASVGEALEEVQESIKCFFNTLPELDVNLVTDGWQLELDFGD